MRGVVDASGAFSVLCCIRMILILAMGSDDDDRPIRPGDLVVITSCFEPGELIPDCPPGLVVEVQLGIPSTGDLEQDETLVCAILWRGFVDRWVDVEWLGRVVDDGRVWVRRPGGGKEDHLEETMKEDPADDDD